VAAVFVATCGWHYLRIWREFGTPLVGNWEAASGFSWWQDPGFHTFGDYARFGRSLGAPLFSGFWSISDGIYSTLWGDALAGGVSNQAFRPPWNHDLMIVPINITPKPAPLSPMIPPITVLTKCRKPYSNNLIKTHAPLTSLSS
jgi:hypothetical protein